MEFSSCFRSFYMMVVMENKRAARLSAFAAGARRSAGRFGRSAFPGGKNRMRGGGGGEKRRSRHR
jgi:hypothetical protein